MSTGYIYLDCFIGGLIGMACHVLFLKLPALKNRAEKANTKFSASAYFRNDWIALSASLVSIIVFIFVLDEILAFKPSLSKWLKFSFVFIGYTGSSILQGILSKTEKNIQKIVDKKTDIADNKTK